MDDLQRQITELRHESISSVTPYVLGWFRAINAVFGGAVIGIVAWLQFSFSATASPPQIAMQPWLFVALVGSMLGLAGSIGLYIVWGLIERWRSRIKGEIRVQALIRASEQSIDDPVPRSELLDISDRETKRAKARHRKLGKSWRWVAGMLALGGALVVSAVSRALWVAYLVQQSAPDPQANCLWML